MVKKYLGASGLQPRLGTRRDVSLGGLERRTAGWRGISLNGLESPTDGNYEVGVMEIDHWIEPRTTDENAKLLWKLVQHDRKREHYQMRQPESPQVYAIRDDGRLCGPDEGKVLSGQLEPSLE